MTMKYTKLAQLTITQTQYTLTIHAKLCATPFRKPQDHRLVRKRTFLTSSAPFQICTQSGSTGAAGDGGLRDGGLQRFTRAKTPIIQSGLNTSTHSNLIGHSSLCPPTVNK